VQIVVSSEIPRDDYGILLKVLGPGIDKADAEQVIALPEEVLEKVPFWKIVVFWNNSKFFLNHFKEEGDMKSWDEVCKMAAEMGMMERYNQKYVQEGIQKGRQEILALLEKGYSLEETKRKLQLA
jgi:hypothetical protein